MRNQFEILIKQNIVLDAFDMFPGESTEFIWFAFPISIIKVEELDVVGGSGVVEESLLKTVKGITFDPFGVIP